MRFPKLAVVALTFLLPAILQAAPNPAVTISEDNFSYTLDNGIVTARVAKCSGDLIFHQIYKPRNARRGFETVGGFTGRTTRRAENRNHASRLTRGRMAASAAKYPSRE
jgi:hypothetical protein